jgi:hypothetical protein
MTYVTIFRLLFKYIYIVIFNFHPVDCLNANTGEMGKQYIIF